MRRLLLLQVFFICLIIDVIKVFLMLLSMNLLSNRLLQLLNLLNNKGLWLWLLLLCILLVLNSRTRVVSVFI